MPRLPRSVRPHHARRAWLAALSVATSGTVLLAACAKGGGDFTVTITARPDTCDLSRTRIPAGRTSFVVRNRADLPVTVSITKPVGLSRADIPTVEPGDSSSHLAGLVGGDYTVACALAGGPTPTHPLLVTGDRREEPPVAQTIELTATDDTLTPPPVFRARAGDHVGVALTNNGTRRYAIRIDNPDGSPLATLAPVGPGERGEVTTTLDRNGGYRVTLVDESGASVAQTTLQVGR